MIQRMKRKRNNLVTVTPTTCHIFTSVLLFLQIINSIGSQTIFEPHDDNHLSAGVTQVNDLKLSKESSQDDFACPRCNILSEVSRRVNQHEFQDYFL